MSKNHIDFFKIKNQQFNPYVAGVQFALDVGSIAYFPVFLFAGALRGLTVLQYNAAAENPQIDTDTVKSFLKTATSKLTSNQESVSDIQGKMWINVGVQLLNLLVTGLAAVAMLSSGYTLPAFAIALTCVSAAAIVSHLAGEFIKESLENQNTSNAFGF